MSEPSVRIGANGVDTEALVREIRERAARKREAGVYADARVARAELHNLLNMREDEGFLDFYLNTLRDAVCVDINDFEIVERRVRFTRILVLLKRVIWKLLCFYTYRLWSQQNQINGLLLSAVETTASHCRERIEALERRVSELENGASR